ncbi:hypothetical protein JCM8547_000449 [Rhodosporidiobolus lusitaniae]
MPLLSLSSLSSSSPPVASPPLPTPPKPIVDVKFIHCFIPDSRISEFLPFDPTFRAANAVQSRLALAADSSLEWTVEKELYHAMFRPECWAVLGKGDERDREFVLKLDEREEEERMRAEEGPARLAEIKRLRDEVEFRRMIRWGRLYTLHTSRQAYLERRFSVLEVDEATFLSSLPLGQQTSPLPAPASSVWPFSRSEKLPATVLPPSTVFLGGLFYTLRPDLVAHWHLAEAVQGAVPIRDPSPTGLAPAIVTGVGAAQSDQLPPRDPSCPPPPPHPSPPPPVEVAPLPTAPSPSVNLDKVHRFIPPSRLNTLLTYDVSSPTHSRWEGRRFLARQKPPVWTVELELYYRIFLADVWVMLKEDDEADRLYVLAMTKPFEDELPRAEQRPSDLPRIRTLMEAAEIPLHSTRSVYLSM